MEHLEPQTAPPLWKRLFPPRQVYFRSRGEVKFISLSPALQQTFAIIGIFIFGWVAFTSIQVLMKDKIMEAKDERIAGLKQQNAEHEADLARLQNEVLSRAGALEERQQYLESLIEMDPTGAINKPEPAPATSPPSGLEDEAEQRTERGAMATPSGPEQDGGMTFLIEAANAAGGAVPAREFEDYAGGQLDEADSDQHRMAAALSDFAAQRLAEADDMLAPFKLKAADLARVSALDDDFTAQGGPFIPLEEKASVREAAPPAFSALHEAWMQMLRVYAGIKSIPLNTPLDDFYISSAFGRRTDPITKQPGWHPGIDLAGWPSTKISTPNAGTVTKAGAWGSYGKMVEIDHGNGFSTRYGHLRKVTVKRGQLLNAGDIIGEMGCTGRCTDTHLHYEVIFNGKLRNPWPFLEAPEDVQQKQRKAPPGNG